MSRTGIHKTTHLHRMAFIGENIANGTTNQFEPSEVKVQKGCRIASAVMKAAVDPEEQDYLNGVITPGLLGAAWEDAFADDFLKKPNDLMYRTIELPRLDLDREVPDFGQTVWMAGVVHVQAAGEHLPFSYSRVRIDKHVINIMRTRRTFRSMGTASLWAGATPTARRVEAGDLRDGQAIQYQVRESGYKMTETTINLARKIGALPAIGQLDDAYSPLTVEFMRSGPAHLREVYLEAKETAAV